MATAEVFSRHFNRGGRRDPVAVRAYSLAVTTIYVVVLFVAWRTSALSVSTDREALISFTLAAIAAELLRVQLWEDMSFSLALPVLLAAGMILPPWQASVVAFIGAVDLREIRRRLPKSRIAFNSSEIALTVMGASFAFHALSDGSITWPYVLFPAFVALGVDALMNAALVSWPASYLHGASPLDALRRMLDPQAASVMRYVGVGLMAPLIATIWIASGIFGLAAFFFPLSLAWSAYQHAERLRDASSQLESKNRSLLAALDQVAAERRDERLALAGGMHDDVLPALYKVHLMGQVLRQDLAEGRLFDLEEDLPPLLEATEFASDMVRRITGEMRESPLGPNGIVAALKSVARELEASSSVRFELQLEDILAPETSQLVVYQVGREAMINASKHAQSNDVVVQLSPSPNGIRLVVKDQGVGFSPRASDKPRHFGLQLMAERAEAAGGRLTVDSMLGQGTVVYLNLPTTLPP